MLDLGGGFFLRHATADDHPALCRVCLETGDAGKDATAREGDPRLMGEIYAVPYQVLEPELAFVVDGVDGVAGYLLGALDTDGFAVRLEAEWYPALRQRVARPPADPSEWSGSDWVRDLVHRPRSAIPDGLSPYPSHGHIDLLPAARGKGIGRRCMSFLEERLAAAGSTGVFLDVHPRNARARAFYAALGYAPVAAAGETDTSIFMAKRLRP